VGEGARVDQAVALEAVEHRHHRRAFDADQVGQRALRQRLARLGDHRDRHPAGLADAEVLEALVDGQAPDARAVVHGGGEALVHRVFR
jgi:hypothetical protein